MFGSKTEQAVKSFQQTYKPTHTTHAQYNLDKTDGVVGRNTVLALDEAVVEQWDSTFHLGWMQSTTTQSQDELWANLFTSETSEEQKQTIKRCNLHLNEPVREGEIVLLPTTEPKTKDERELLNLWIEQAKIASKELGKLLDEEVATLNRHFELFSHQLEERIESDG
ncbi:peptidoglycan-binding domain-containing protein, partial [Vibrio sp. TRT 29B02]|uniref:peptidoglycan-binding domain-containing protein n=1 Tax=Vibrio sp. TRT 29B02 TaxID=3418508 RepID=UPI003CF86D61